MRWGGRRSEIGFWNDVHGYRTDEQIARESGLAAAAAIGYHRRTDERVATELGITPRHGADGSKIARIGQAVASISTTSRPAPRASAIP